MMENETAAILAQLIRIADALESIASRDGWKPCAPADSRYSAAFEIAQARMVREEIVQRAKRASALLQRKEMP